MPTTKEVTSVNRTAVMRKGALMRVQKAHDALAMAVKSGARLTPAAVELLTALYQFYPLIEEPEVPARLQYALAVAHALSIKHRCVQHVNRTLADGFAINDFSDGSTVASFECGRALL